LKRRSVFLKSDWADSRAYFWADPTRHALLRRIELVLDLLDLDLDVARVQVHQDVALLDHEPRVELVVLIEDPPRDGALHLHRVLLLHGDASRLRVDGVPADDGFDLGHGPQVTLDADRDRGQHGKDDDELDPERDPFGFIGHSGRGRWQIAGSRPAREMNSTHWLRKPDRATAMLYCVE
jgi:hypothetical protein